MSDLRDSLARLAEARRLLDAGRNQALLDFLGTRPEEDVRGSASMALFYGIAHARLGRHAEGRDWVAAALQRSRATGDLAVTARALNALGLIALERGDVAEAERALGEAVEAAQRAEDSLTLGRASNNLGVITNLRGDYEHALVWYGLALAAYERAGVSRIVADVHHNIGITRRDQGRLVEALDAAARAVEEAERAGDATVLGMTLAGRAEVRTAQGDADLGRLEAERALAIHRELRDPVREAEDLRILAAAWAATGEAGEAERLLREVIGRAESQGRTLLAATAGRDLARLLAERGRGAEARPLARLARDRFASLGAHVEAQRLEDLADRT